MRNSTSIFHLSDYALYHAEDIYKKNRDTIRRSNDTCSALIDQGQNAATNNTEKDHAPRKETKTLVTNHVYDTL